MRSGLEVWQSSGHSGHVEGTPRLSTTLEVCRGLRWHIEGLTSLELLMQSWALQMGTVRDIAAGCICCNSVSANM